MDNGLAMIAVASVTTVGGIIVAFIQIFKKENREDHAMVMDALRSVHKTIGRVEDKLDRHLVWHSEGKNGNVPRGSKKA
jgi:hypothetical protein